MKSSIPITGVIKAKVVLIILFICSLNVQATPPTWLIDQHCDITVNTLTAWVCVYQIPNATRYEFRFTDQDDTTNVLYVDTTSYAIQLYWVNGIEYNQIYDVDVRALVDTTWSDFDKVCYVRILTPTTQLASGSCNITVDQLHDYQYANFVPLAVEYHFRFTDQNDTTSVLTYTTVGQYQNWFKLYQIPGMQYDHTYDVDVEVQYNTDELSGYGAVCEIEILLPTTQLIPSQCDDTLSAMNEFVYCHWRALVDSYEFRFTDINNPGTVLNLVRPGSSSNYFQPQWVPGIALSTTYDVDVRIYTEGVWGSYGGICQLTTPETSSKWQGDPLFGFIPALETTVYPNPAKNYLNLTLTSHADQMVQMQMVDLAGHVVISRSLAVSEGEQVIYVGDLDLPAGLYMLNLQQNAYRTSHKIMIMP